MNRMVRRFHLIATRGAAIRRISPSNFPGRVFERKLSLNSHPLSTPSTAADTMWPPTHDLIDQRSTTALSVSFS